MHKPRDGVGGYDGDCDNENVAEDSVKRLRICASPLARTNRCRCLVFCWTYDLTDRLSVAGNVGLFVPTSEDGRFFQTTNSLTSAYALTDKLGAYVEYYGLYPNNKGTDCAHTVDGGFTYLITDNLQLDWRIGFGLNEEADDFLMGVGLSWRF